MAQAYVIQEWFVDVVCEKSHADCKIRKCKTCDHKLNHQCGQRINCSRRIHEITTSKDYAITRTKDKPTWGYEPFILTVGEEIP